MDLFWLHRGQQFVLDGEKAASNLARNGVSFETACQVFFDPFVRFEEASAESEQYEAAIGLGGARMHLLVVHVLREADVIRVISARPASAQERKFYEDGN